MLNGAARPALLYYPDFHPRLEWLRSILLVTDEVKRIVPADFATDDPEPLKEMIGEVEGCLGSVPPSEVEITPSWDELQRLERAFHEVSKYPAVGSTAGEFTLVIGPHGQWSFPGFTFMADRKISDAVRHALHRTGMIGTRQQRVYAEHLPANSTVVRLEACYLILSLVADHMARRQGFTTITDRPLDYTLNALNGLKVVAPTNLSEGLLTSAFATVLIPAEVVNLRLNDYRILRESYAGLRASVTRFVQQSNEWCRLDRIEDPHFLEQRLAEAASSLRVEFDHFRKTRFARSIAKWTPFSLGGLLTVVGAYQGLSQEWAWSMAGASFGFNLLDRICFRAASAKEKVFSIATTLDYDIKALL
jgi:hypothetical protein